MGQQYRHCRGGEEDPWVKTEELHGRYVWLRQRRGAAGHQGIPTLPWEL